MGNVIILSDASSGGFYGNDAILWNSNSMFFVISNNLVISSDNGIYIAQTAGSNAGVNEIVNCTVNWVSTNNSSYTAYAIYARQNASGLGLEIMNNCIARNATATTTTNYGVYVFPGSGATDIFYNYIDNTFTQIISASGAIQGNNSTSSHINLGAGPAVATTATYPPATTSLGYPTLGVGVNGGNPGNIYANIDGTRNTVGAYGGSYTLYNFFPLNKGAGRIWSTNMPLSGVIGGTINVKAISFDR
jgi:hypothetical protein